MTKTPPLSTLSQAQEDEMLCERLGLAVGSFFLAPGMVDGNIWIGRGDGEGGDFSADELSEVIAQFYDQRF